LQIPNNFQPTLDDVQEISLSVGLTYFVNPSRQLTSPSP
jgi:hypothetical protein